MESNTNSHLSIVLLSYNSVDYLREFLPILIRFTPSQHEIVVVNNGSTDNTSSFLQENFPQLRVISIAVNRGFTNGYVESLAQIKAKYYCLLSSDIEVTPNWTEPIFDLMEKNEDIAACQPKIKSYHRRDEFEYAGAGGGYLDKYGYLFCRGRLFYSVEKDLGQYDDVAEVFWASGASLFVRADIYHELGGLDDDFYAHMEEVDLCWRMKNAGYRVMSVNTSTVYHVGGSIISYGSPLKTYRNYRNNLILLVKNLPGNQLIWKLPYRMILDGIAFFHMLFGGHVKLAFTIIKSHLHFHTRFFYWMKKRRATQAMVKKGVKISFYPYSIVWKYFAEKKRRFSDLHWKYRA